MKYLRGNQQPFMTKEFSKAVMTRSRLRNIFLKNHNDTNRTNYVKQRNFCVNLLRRIKRTYYSNLNINKVTDNKTFWKTVKPCFSDKINTNEQITLIEDNEIISDDQKISNIMVEYFNNIVNNLDIPDNAEFINHANILITDNVEKAILKYDHHPSIMKIKEKNLNTSMFKFKHTTLHNINNIILELDIKKATFRNGIPTKLLKQKL